MRKTDSNTGFRPENNEAMVSLPISEKMWNAYKMKCETSFVTRNGTIACGVTLPSPFEDVYRKPEFVAEHEGRTAFLLALVVMYDGGNLTSMLCRPEALFYRDMFYYMTFLLCHDVGEIGYGDALDDGSKCREEVRAEEERLMQKLFCCLPMEIQPQMSAWQKDFESYRGAFGTQLIKALDKAEAVAFQLFLATQGVEGNVLHKNPPSERDLRFAELTGTVRSIDVWCLHYRIVTRDMPKKITEPIYDFLSAGFHDVFGPELPRCMTMDVSAIELD